MSSAAEQERGAARRYFDNASRLLADLWSSQQAGMEQGAEWLAQALARDGLLFVAGSGHSHMLAEELFYRAGGLAAVVPLLEPALMLHDGAVKSSSLERLEGYAAIVLDDAELSADDILIIASNSGRNAYAVELAQEARARGCKTIAVTSLATAQRVESRHSSGKLLADVADLVLDNCVPYGDASVQIKGTPLMAGPLSTIAGVALLNAMVVQAIELVSEGGHPPDVFVSANVKETDGGAVNPNLASWRQRVRRL